jgi:hypothetical protein
MRLTIKELAPGVLYKGVNEIGTTDHLFFVKENNGEKKLIVLKQVEESELLDYKDMFFTTKEEKNGN